VITSTAARIGTLGLFTVAVVGLAGAVLSHPANTSSAATPVAAAPVATTPEPPGAIAGSVYDVDDSGVKHPQNHLVLVVPAAIKQPVDLSSYESPGATANIPSSRAGVGLVQPDTSGIYFVTGLATGDYLVAALAPTLTYAVEPPEAVQAQASPTDPPLTARAFKVTVTAGSTVSGIDFAFASPSAPGGPGSLTIHIVTYDPATFEAAPDNAVAVTLDPSVPTAKITTATDSTVTIEDVPPGTYQVVVRTSRGFVIAHEVVFTPGTRGEATWGFGPPEPGGASVQLPGTGTPPVDGGSPSIVVVLAIAALLLAGGLSAVLLARRRETVGQGSSRR